MCFLCTIANQLKRSVKFKLIASYDENISSFEHIMYYGFSFAEIIAIIIRSKDFF